jgi:hypothetical protein
MFLIVVLGLFFVGASVALYISHLGELEQEQRRLKEALAQKQAFAKRNTKPYPYSRSQSSPPTGGSSIRKKSEGVDVEFDFGSSDSHGDWLDSKHDTHSDYSPSSYTPSSYSSYDSGSSSSSSSYDSGSSYGGDSGSSSCGGGDGGGGGGGD